MIPLLLVVWLGAAAGPAGAPGSTEPGAGAHAARWDTGGVMTSPDAPCPVPPGMQVIPTRLDSWVQGMVARAWDVPADCVEVEWPVGAPESMAPGSAVEGWGPGAWAPEGSALEGSGTGGRWTVALPEDGRVRRVPVRTSVRVLVPVAARTLSRGSVVEPSDVDWKPGVRTGPSDPGSAMGIPGSVVARPLAPGDILAPPAIRPPVAVRVGEGVMVVWNGTTVQARREGTALRTGALGDTVDVRLGPALRRRARVTGTGMVELIRPGAPGRNDR
jgi:flagella basal body P-ring formation protein FlgA